MKTGHDLRGEYRAARRRLRRAIRDELRRPRGESPGQYERLRPFRRAVEERGNALADWEMEGAYDLLAAELPVLMKRC